MIYQRKNKRESLLMPKCYALLSSKLSVELKDAEQITADTDLSDLTSRAPTAVNLSVSQFTDGKVFSSLKLLRRLGYQGHIIVSGEFIDDQASYLAQCGATVLVVESLHQQTTVNRLLSASIDSYHVREIA